MDDLLKKCLSEYNRWVKNTSDDPAIQEELSGIRDNHEEIINDFCTELEFGTSGIRAIMGPGPGRLNKYVIRKITQGFSDYINSLNLTNPSVVIAYDSRNFSKEFAEETAAVLSGNGITAYLFNKLAPVSVLSYSIDETGADFGIMITASHNPGIFNGYKVYNSKGYQILDDVPKEILKAISVHDYFSGILMNREKVNILSDEISDNFIDDATSILKRLTHPDKKEIKIVYTPLNGAGNLYVRRVLDNLGFSDVSVVAEQEFPDGNFTTCKSPNPEKLTAYNEAFKLLDKNNADIILATDPDSDRVGAALIHNGTKRILSGNQLALLMLDYLTETIPPTEGQVCYRSVVSSPLFDRLAESNGLTVKKTLIGFKYIGEAIADLISGNKSDEFYFGFEESNGFLISPFTRDKDGVTGAALIALTAAKQKARGIDLIDRLEEIYDDYGLLIDKSRSFTFEGFKGQEVMTEIMEYIRKLDTNIGDLYIEEKTDYLYDETGLPPANMVRFDMDDGSTVIVRPSGTEPKIKVYMFLTDSTSSTEGEIIKIFDSFKIRN